MIGVSFNLFMDPSRSIDFTDEALPAIWLSFCLWFFEEFDYWSADFRYFFLTVDSGSPNCRFSFSMSTAFVFLGVYAFEILSVDLSFSARRRLDKVVLFLSCCSAVLFSGGNGSTNSCYFWLFFLGSFGAGGTTVALLICSWSFLFFSTSWGDDCKSASLSFWSFLFAVLFGLFDVDSLLAWLLLSAGYNSCTTVTGWIFLCLDHILTGVKGLCT